MQWKDGNIEVPLFPLRHRARTAEYHVRKARYGHVLQSLKRGAAYSFDAESFSRFSTLAREDGIEPVDYTPANRGRPDGPAISLMRVNWVPI